MNFNYQHPALDSFSVWTPIQIFDDGTQYIDTILEVNDRTGEIVKETQKPVFLEIDGIKFRVSKVSLFGKEYIVTTWNSKMLCYLYFPTDNYFRGVTYTQFKKYAEYWLNAIQLKVNINEFIQSSFVTDCDFKVDFVMLESQYQELLLRYSTVPSSKLYKSKPNSVLDIPVYSGLTFVNRNDASIKTPFVKLYSKLEELNQRSSEFKYKFLLNWENRYLRRLECTVKNTRHFQQLAKIGILSSKFKDSNARLIDVLLIKPDTIKRACEYMLTLSLGMGGIQYKANIEDKPSKPITPTQFFFGALANELMLEGHSFEGIIGLMDGFPSSDTHKATAKTRIKTNLKKGLAYYRTRFDVAQVRTTKHDAFLTALTPEAIKHLKQIEKRAKNHSK